MTEPVYPFWARLIARMIDGAIFAVLGFLGLFLYFIDPEMVVFCLYIIPLLYPVYSIILHTLYGQTIGKKVMKLRLLSVSGQKASVLQALPREVILFLIIYFQAINKTMEQFFDFTPVSYSNEINIFLLVCTVVFMFMNKKRRSFYDYLTGTVVVPETKRIH